MGVTYKVDFKVAIILVRVLFRKVTVVSPSLTSDHGLSAVLFLSLFFFLFSFCPYPDLVWSAGNGWACTSSATSGEFSGAGLDSAAASGDIAEVAGGFSGGGTLRSGATSAPRRPLFQFRRSRMLYSIGGVEKRVKWIRYPDRILSVC